MPKNPRGRMIKVVVVVVLLFFVLSLVIPLIPWGSFF